MVSRTSVFLATLTCISNTDLHSWESGGSSVKKLVFYPSNPGSTPARVKMHKKGSKTTKCGAFKGPEFQGVPRR